MSDTSNRKFGVGYFFGLLLFLLIAKLFHLQILQKKYGSGSSSVAVIEEEVLPSRGLIYDRNDSLIVYNSPVYDIYFKLNKIVDENQDELAKFLGIEKEYLQEKIKTAREKRFYKKPYPLLKDLSGEDYALLQEDIYKYPSLVIKSSTERRYKHPYAAMILGYLGEVNTKDIQKSEGYYSLGENIGKTGIEKTFEDSLKGTKGFQFMLRDKNNVVQGKYKDGEHDIPAIPGKDLYTTLDINLQGYAEQLMNGKVGSVVAIEPSTGEILTMVSSPSYDPNWLTGRKRSKYFKALLVDSLKPMFNRSVSAQYPPGSTFKPLASLVGLEVGQVGPGFRFPCNGGYSLNKGKPGCHDHKPLTGVQDAIKQSCNAYYAENFRRTLLAPKYKKDVRQALDDFRNYMKSFGYATKYDIGVGGVEAGSFPSSNFYDNIYKGWDWNPLTIISLSIGQGEIQTTTLQMAQSVAVVANRGKAIDPHLIKAFSEEAVETVAKDIPIAKKHFEPVIDGMEKTFTEGTARASLIDGIAACGKTGTAENFAIINGERVQLKDHSLFVAFAPKEDPKIAVAVIIENGGYGSTYAAPIASLMIEKYIKDSIPSNRKYIEKRMLEANLLGFDKDNYLDYVAQQQERKRIRDSIKQVQDSLEVINKKENIVAQ